MILTLFVTYARPSELMAMRVSDVVAPAPRSIEALASPAVILCPRERLVQTRTQQFDDTVLLEHPDFPFLGEKLLSVARSRRKVVGPEGSLWSVSVQDLRSRFNEATAALGLPQACCLYQMRHGGAAHDPLQQVRTWDEVKSSGLWFSDTSVRRSAKSGMIQRFLSLVPQEVIEYGEIPEDALPGAMSHENSASFPVFCAALCDAPRGRWQEQPARGTARVR